MLPSLLLLSLGGASGCNEAPYDLAPVSGVVTLDGQPVEGATVKFSPDRPFASEEEIVGPGSLGRTDSRGRYQLHTFKDERGATVGLHRVKISTFRQEFVDIRRSNEVETISEERIPARYSRSSSLTFDVPKGGTRDADFALTTEKTP